MLALEILGRGIAKARAKRGLTQEDLAGVIEMDRSYISQIENGRTNVTILALMRIAKALGVRPSALVRSMEAGDDPS